MDLLQLKYFQVVARLEHISRAARELYVSQPALSASIAKLESDLGVQLFTRLGRNIVLNEAGKLFREKVNIALNALETGQREIREIADYEDTMISIATVTSVTFSTAIMPFKERYPHYTFRIGQTELSEMLVQLRNFDVDFCFCSRAVDLPGVECAHLLTQKLFLTVPESHALAGRGSIRLEEVKDEPFIVLKSDTTFQQLIDSIFERAAFCPKVSCEVFQASLIASLVCAGMGVSLLPYTFAEHKGLVSLDISEPLCTHDLYLVWIKDRHMSNACQTFLQFTLSSLKDRPRGASAFL